MFEKVVNKYGYDKLLHFSFGGEICACLTMILFALFALFIPASGAMFISYVLSVIAVYGISYYKEAKIDAEFSWADINFSVLGCVPIGVIVVIVALLLLI